MNYDGVPKKNITLAFKTKEELDRAIEISKNIAEKRKKTVRAFRMTRKFTEEELEILKEFFRSEDIDADIFASGERKLTKIIDRK